MTARLVADHADMEARIAGLEAMLVDAQAEIERLRRLVGDMLEYQVVTPEWEERARAALEGGQP